MAQTLTRNKTNAFAVEIATNTQNADAERHHNGAFMIDVPQHIQSSLDAVLEYYAQSGTKPEIKLCGNPLDIVSDFITKMQETLPAHLNHQAKDVLDFMIRELCGFCKERSMNYLTLHFSFNRSYQAEAA